jgi:hypothetical protein
VENKEYGARLDGMRLRLLEEVFSNDISSPLLQAVYSPVPRAPIMGTHPVPYRRHVLK